MPDLSLYIFALHPLPWSIRVTDSFGECLPLTIMDANGNAVCSIVGHGAVDDHPTANDWLVAQAILAAMTEERARTTFIRCHNCPAPHVCTEHDTCLL